MTVWFLAFLAVAWIIVYLPSVWRARQSSPLPAVQGFKRRMRLIAPRSRSGRWVVIPESRERLVYQAQMRAQQRRKKVLSGLIAVAVVTGVWALAAGGNAVELHLVVDAVVVFYIALMLEQQRRRTERRTKVHTLPRSAEASDFLEADPRFGMLEAGGGSRS